MDRLRTYQPSILVIGDLMLDHYLWGKCERISPEAPVQVVDIQNESTVLGGAGNVVNNLLSLGAKVNVLSVVGEDENGKELLCMLETLGAVVKGIVQQTGRKTSKKSRVIASHQQVVRYDSESKEEITETSAEALLAQCIACIPSVDIILLSDYGKGVLTPSFTCKVIELAKKHQKPIFVDPKGDDYHKYSGATLITPNKKEASIATKIAINDDESLQKAGRLLKESLGLEYAIITLSEDGMAIFGEQFLKMPTVAREVYDVTGAGDTVLAALGYAYASGQGIQEAASFANKAAAVVVEKLGSATVTLDEIDAYEHSLRSATAESKLKSIEEITRLLHTKKHQKIVFTNGCFDILHVGHVKYLEIAKSFGDVLIVGLNSDDSIKRLKGQSRPINPLEDRAYILASLESVSYVVPFEEDTPLELISVLKPDILVKGTDYEGKEVVGSDIAKEVRLVQFVEGKSTTRIIERIQQK
ncbi:MULTISPECIES: D-glycero-beta-D-manno-heptose-7-phosphate kinase [unclassified Sulfurospirillum]|uniref:D-glycero-beta-D-manno-heptose-7-phosphate kinase n=1 Tax=unclassified Sulfurospirillum TaxID=2618290 RepID=UPI00050433D8|nr:MULTISPECIES: D-glycero-beta-D-manno-heptose-7-phosphate kinase [unclassified Sulfurospirillum]KFL34013.1 cytochrome C biogenesis protein CcdA [Sulfurospirillum sp. SCADC]